MEEIGVRLLGRGEAWAMVPAQHVGGNIYCIIQNDVEEREGCELEFKPGNLVFVMDHQDSAGNEFLGAMRLRGLP